MSCSPPHLLVESLYGPNLIARTSPFRGIDDLFVTFIAPVQRAHPSTPDILVGWALPDTALRALAISRDEPSTDGARRARTCAGVLPRTRTAAAAVATTTSVNPAAYQSTGSV